MAFPVNALDMYVSCYRVQTRCGSIDCHVVSVKPISVSQSSILALRFLSRFSQFKLDVTGFIPCFIDAYHFARPLRIFVTYHFRRRGKLRRRRRFRRQNMCLVLHSFNFIVFRKKLDVSFVNYVECV